MFDFDDLDADEGTDAKAAGSGGAPDAGGGGSHVDGGQKNPQPPARPNAAPGFGVQAGNTKLNVPAWSQPPSLPSPAALAAADDDGPKFWKVVKTIDAGGITVWREEACHNAMGRIPLNTIVMETERKGNIIRFANVAGHIGPKSGWVKIETKGNRWMTCLGSRPQASPASQLAASAQKLRAIFIFDWDDTLCPSTWIQHYPEADLIRELGQGKGDAREMLARHSQAVKELVELAMSIGTVALVTLAERPWVSISVNDFMPEAKVVTGLDVFYAREVVSLVAPPGVCPLTVMKRRTMQLAIMKLVEKLGEGTTWESFLSIGDSEVEKKAAQDVGRDCQVRGIVKFTKTVKLMEHPTIAQLTSQVRSLCGQLQELVDYQGHKQMKLEH